MEIQIRLQQALSGLKSRKIKYNLSKVLKDLGCDDKELSILVTDDSQMTELNRRYLGQDTPTNVLSFSMSEGQECCGDSNILGDIVVSGDTALREAEALGQPLEYRVNRLIVHGLLHLLGFDHTKSDAEADRMEDEEERLMALIMEGE